MLKTPKKTRFPEWQGFEKTPLGALLDIVVDQSGRMGIAYERSCDFWKERHAHDDRWQITFARGGCKLKVRTFRPGGSHRLHSKNASILPPGIEHEALGESAVYDTFTVYPTKSLMEECELALGLKRGDAQRRAHPGRVFQRSDWLHQLVEKYFTLRVIEQAALSDISFLEREICLETLRALLGRTEKEPRYRLVSQDETPFVKALHLMESHLFDDLDLEKLAAKAGISASTLLRSFKKEIGLTPYAYLRKRRMEEARELLLHTERPIGEISTLVGFSNQGAFTDAFRSVFGKSPLAWRKAAGGIKEE